MTTPNTNIKSSHFNTEILRVSSSAQVSLSSVRTRYGGSGKISFGDLRKAEGFIITVGSYYEGGKIPIDVKGYSTFFGPTGSVTPVEESSRLKFSANSYMRGFHGSNTGSGSILHITGSANTSSDPVAGFRGTDVTRIVTANTSRTLGTNSNSHMIFTYSWPANGTQLHCLVKF